MLWYKAWLETRARFLISLFGILFLCSYCVLHLEQEAVPGTLLSYYNYVLTEGYGMLVMMWVLAVTLLMMGGLLREHALGSASFTLGLPVSRRRLMMVRVGVGALEASAIAIIPTASMCVIASIWGKPFSLSQNLFHLVLLLAGGAFFFAIALLVSSVVRGEYTAPVVALGVLLLIAVTLGDQKMRLFSPLEFMLGGEYFNRSSSLLVGPIPWVRAGLWVCLAALLTWVAVRVVDRKEF
ncbi:ABC transporter permease subunit [Granulicella sp. S156]|jgi:ABC-2 type transport system permease protein|uniref:ABC transporter permease subunit n=1 Tax=Granulicella sp. S156 TaxID=1747224 RepID=UPI00131C0BEB|nr:ABC transporter permease subunit [Granulicella sp. S156]